MPLPNPLPPAGLQVLVYDHSGDERPGVVVLPSASWMGQTLSLVTWPTIAGWLFEHIDFDDTSDPPTALTYRYDPEHPPDALPGTLDARMDVLEDSDGAQDVAIAALQAATAALEAASALYAAALAEIRTKYEAHSHLPSGQTPQGENGDLTYELPGE